MRELPKDRLQQARKDAGFETPTDAARAFRDINQNTLISHENGNRPLSRKAAEKYATAFGVEAGWLQRQGNKHEVWYSPITNYSFTVPRNLKSRHTANDILKQAGIDFKF